MPQTIPESKATNKHCREVWLHLQAAMTFSTALHVPICWFRHGNRRYALKTLQQKRELHIFCLIHGNSGPFGHLEPRKEDGVLRR